MALIELRTCFNFYQLVRPPQRVHQITALALFFVVKGNLISIRQSIRPNYYKSRVQVVRENLVITTLAFFH